MNYVHNSLFILTPIYMLTKNNVRKEKNIFVEAMHYSSLAFAICSHILQTSFLPQNDISLTFRYLIHYLLLAFCLDGHRFTVTILVGLYLYIFSDYFVFAFFCFAFYHSMLEKFTLKD